jgi:hypothetical protein
MALRDVERLTAEVERLKQQAKSQTDPVAAALARFDARKNGGV